MGMLILLVDALIAFSVIVLTRVMALGVLLLALCTLFYLGDNLVNSLQLLDQSSPLAPLTKLGMRGEN
jgi:hypothetical protein